MMLCQKNMFSKIAFELGNTVKTSNLDNKACKFPLSLKYFSSRAFYEIIPEAVVPEVEDKIFLAQKIENVSALPHELPEDSILVTFPVNRMGSFDLLRSDFKVLNEKFNRLSKLESRISKLETENIKLSKEIRELSESESILLNQYLVINLPQLLENCASRVLRDHDPEMELALGRYKRLNILLKMVKQDHPNSSEFLKKPEVLALIQARKIMLDYDGVKKRNLLRHDRNIWFLTLSRALSKLEYFASFHDDLTKKNLPYFNKILDSMLPWKDITLESDLRPLESDESEYD